MKKQPALLMILPILLVSCNSNNNEVRTIKGEDLDPNGGADNYNAIGDHDDSNYFNNIDYFEATSNGHLTIISKFKTFQQTTEYTCGPCSLLMSLYNLGITNYTEKSLSNGFNCVYEGDNAHGTGIEDMVTFLNKQTSFKVVASSYHESYTSSDLYGKEDGVLEGNLKSIFKGEAPYVSGYDTNNEPIYTDIATETIFYKWVVSFLNNNEAITILWCDWNGHYQDIIGYDTMGTTNIGDDVLILADPYDTSDHHQDGYYVVSVERFYSMWIDYTAAKPYQYNQYVVLGKN